MNRWAMTRHILAGLSAVMLSASAAGAEETGQACLAAGLDPDPTPAIEVCSRAIDAGTVKGAMLAKVDLQRAEGFYRAGRLDRALNDVDAALAVDADFAEALVLRARIYNRSRQPELALRDVLRAISLKPSTRNAYLTLASIFTRAGVDRRKVVAALRQEIEYHPDNWLARRDLAECYLECLGRIDEGLAEINKVIAAGPEAVGKQFIWHRSPRDHFDLYAYAIDTRANMYRRLRKFDLAKADYDWLIAHWPKEPRFYHHRGELFNEANQDSKALTDFNKALALDPYNDTARIERAGLLIRRNRYDDALAAVNQLIQGSTVRALAFRYRADIYKKKGAREAALEDLEQAFGMDRVLVQRYQHRLIGAGYYDGEPDGVYSEAMRNGVKACLIDTRCQP